MKKIIKLSMAGLFLLASCTTNAPTDIKTSTTPAATAPANFSIKSEDVSYYPEKAAVKGFIAYPEKNGKYPSLILIHEWWGLNDNIKDLAKKFAALGYVAMAADLYGGQSTTDQKKAQELASSVSGNNAEAINNLKSGVNFLKARADVIPERIASVGWCFGGGWSYQMAKNDLGVKATVM
jgi:carboxymethylenebutenolidase